MELSIIIPVYNAEKYIRECLDSVICKKYDCEVILVNDGSSDSSLTICEEYSRRDDRIKIVNKNNGGVSSARNAGLLQATGKYVMFLDADDYFTDDAFEYIDKYIKCDKYDFVAMSYSSLFEDMDRYSRRAVMAIVIANLPVFFNNMDEFKKYVHVALSQCTDSAERQACMTIINSMFING